MGTKDQVGQKIGNYRVTGLLGEGGFGAVYVAEHPVIGRKVAIKLLAPHLSLHPGISQRFAAEGKAVTRIDHPNVIEIFDFGKSDDGQFYFVMELLKGRELQAVIEEQAPMPLPVVAEYVEQICGGLQAAHFHGIVHRDLKPENIFVLDKKPLAIKLLDFGIAKILESEESASKTATGVVMGSPLTIAPEQAASEREKIGPRTDLYSLGVILYWMLAGRPPFIDSMTPVLLAKHITDRPPPLREVKPSVPEEVARIVDQCLEKDPAARPSSAMEIAQRITDAARSCVQPTVQVSGPPPKPASSPAPAEVSAVPAAAPVTAATVRSGPERHERESDATESDAPAPVTTLQGAAVEVPAATDELPRDTGLVKWLALGGGAVVIAVIGFLLLRSSGDEREGEQPIAARGPDAQVVAEKPPDLEAPARPDATRVVAAPKPAAAPRPAAAPKPAPRVVAAPKLKPAAPVVAAAKPAASRVVAAPKLKPAASRVVAGPRARAPSRRIKRPARRQPVKPARPARSAVGRNPHGAEWSLAKLMLQQARKAYISGNYSKARRLSRDVLGRSPGNADALQIHIAACCYLKDRMRAQKIVSQYRLSRGRRVMVKRICERNGIVLRFP